ncbi:hypothetical protein [Clostridium sp. Marseille-P2415]|uniref:hypothetical protein n=1 Tax=Clostridium sp. Marseille-P2415 TaxID=1805471 RepID=UPI0009888600|nr:hypothetical protein [Clostridium sp. Marseille-P2415]
MNRNVKWLVGMACGCAVRIPSGDESEHIVQSLELPNEYMFPCYLAIGYPEDNTMLPEQVNCNIEEKIHLNAW